MTDRDSQILRALISKHGFEKILLEMVRMTRSWAAVSPRWHKAWGLLWSAHCAIAGKQVSGGRPQLRFKKNRQLSGGKRRTIAEATKEHLNEATPHQAA